MVVEELVDYKKICEVLGISRQYLTKQINKPVNPLPYRMVGNCRRFVVKDVLEWSKEEARILERKKAKK